MDMSRYRELFLSETREHLNQMSQLLVVLEQAPDDRETIDALFREAHSVKGMAASMGYERTAALAHHLEDALDGFRRGAGVPAEAVDRLLAGLDLLEGLLEDLQADQPERDVAAFLATPVVAELPADNLVLLAEVEEDDAGPGEAAEAVPTVAVPVVPVGAVFQVTVVLAEDTMASAARCLLIVRELERSGEILSVMPTRETLRQGAACLRVQVWLRTVVPKPRLEEALRAIADVDKVTFVDDRRTVSGRRGGDSGRSVRVRTDLLDQLVNLTGELLTRRFMLQRAATARDWRELDAALAETTRLLGDLHHQVLQVRLMPLESITGRLPRLVRDLARKSGKEVEFKLIGGGVGIDRVILEELSDPLVHLVRNAIDHGINERGEVAIAARREKDLVLIEVSDNGRGMDPVELRRLAVARGLLTPAQAEQYTDREALMLVCVPGFLHGARRDRHLRARGRHGRGQVGGREARRHSRHPVGPGRGDPLPAASAAVGGDHQDPAGRLRRATAGDPADPGAAHPRSADRGRVRRGRPALLPFDDEAIELVSLGERLGLAVAAAADSLCVVLTEVQGRRVGLQVDHFFGQREAFVKNLGFPLDRLPGMSGATVEADGSVVFIIDPHPLLEGPAASMPARYEENPHALS